MRSNAVKPWIANHAMEIEQMNEKAANTKEKNMNVKDKRIKLTTEMLNGIKVNLHHRTFFFVKPLKFLAILQLINLQNIYTF